MKLGQLDVRQKSGIGLLRGGGLLVLILQLLVSKKLFVLGSYLAKSGTFHVN